MYYYYYNYIVKALVNRRQVLQQVQLKAPIQYK